MTDLFPWLPIGFAIEDLATGKLVGSGPGYQILQERDGVRQILLLNLAILPDTPALLRLLDRGKAAKFGNVELTAVIFANDPPIKVADIAKRKAAIDGTELKALTFGLDRLRSETPRAAWNDAIFVEEDANCIPISFQDDRPRRRELAVSIMTSGPADQSLSASQINAVAKWLTLEDINAFLALVGDPVQVPRTAAQPVSGTAPFYLAGQPGLTKVFNEYVVDPLRDPARYKALGVEMPNGILLIGKSGVGKTFAAMELSNHLGWNTVEVSLGSIGSSLIHETSRTLRHTVDQVAKNAPSLIIVNEIDAMTGERGKLTQAHTVEETNEMLTLVEHAAERSILFIGTTNRPEAMDPAFLRKGRFDVQVTLGFPNIDQISEMLQSLIADRPTAPGLNFEGFALDLVGRPPSDVKWLVNEAARIAAKAQRDVIDEGSLIEAMARLKAEYRS